MKRLLMLSWCLMSATQAFAARPPPSKVVKINDRIFALLGPMALPNKENRGFMVNSGLVILVQCPSNACTHGTALFNRASASRAR